MTDEILDKSYEIRRKIKSYKSFLSAFDAPYINIIKANDYRGDNDKSRIIILSSEPELESIIIKYFADKIESLEREYEQIN